MSSEPWIPFCIKEIDAAVAKGKRLDSWEFSFMATVRFRDSQGLGLTPKQVERLQKLHARMTEISRIKR